MGFFDTLFGRTKLEPPKLDRLFAMSTAYVTMDSALGLHHAGRGGICFRPVSSGTFEQSARDMRELLESAGAESGTRIDVTKDEHGFTWVTFEDDDLDDVVTALHLASSELEAQGYGEQLLCALFRFRGDGHDPVYWVYAYKRGTWYPFVPTGTTSGRDNAFELRLQGIMAGELPVEPELERWFPLWGSPV
jgi:hypothetical protein